MSRSALSRSYAPKKGSENAAPAVQYDGSSSQYTAEQMQLQQMQMQQMHQQQGISAG
jgi:hypothetical protein